MAEPVNLQLFVGAGISLDAGLPGFLSLRAEVYGDVLGKGIARIRRKHLKVRLAELAPEYAMSLVNRDDKARAFVCSRLQGGRPTAEHRLLAEAMANGAKVYTPNFDSLIEAAAWGALRTAVRGANTHVNSSAQLVKLHGSCPDILVTAEDVLAPITGSWQTQLIEDCDTPDSHLVVWGYRASDPDLLPLVIAAAGKASQCTWLAFEDTDDLPRAESLLARVPHARIEPLHGNAEVGRRIIQSIVDPRQRVDLRDPPPPQLSRAEFHISDASTRASALAHIAGPRLARVAWWTVLLSGDRSAVDALASSYLFDSRLVQAATLALLPTVMRTRGDPRLWQGFFLAAEGHGIRPRTTDRLVALYRTRGPKVADGVDAKELFELDMRIVTMLRLRGRLREAVEMIDTIDRSDITSRQRLDAAWQGRLTYERAILRRLTGDFTGAARALATINTEGGPFVGLNWSMWLAHERAALALWHNDVAEATSQITRAKELAAAYGNNARAIVDLMVREIELDILRGVEHATIRNEARRAWATALTHGVLTPVRRAWLNGVVADSARHAGLDALAARRYLEVVRISPDCVHQIAGACGLLALGRPVPTSLSRMVALSGSTRTSQLHDYLERPTDDASTQIIDWASELRSRRGLTFVS